MFVNLTPHKINIYLDKGIVIEVPPSGKILRLEEKVIERGLCDEGVPVVTKKYRIKDLPEEKENITYLVSLIVLPYLPQERGDFVAPDTGPDSAIRDDEGKIIGVKRLISHQQ